MVAHWTITYTWITNNNVGFPFWKGWTIFKEVNECYRFQEKSCKSEWSINRKIGCMSVLFSTEGIQNYMGTWQTFTTCLPHFNTFCFQFKHLALSLHTIWHSETPDIPNKGTSKSKWLVFKPILQYFYYTTTAWLMVGAQPRGLLLPPTGCYGP